MIQTIDNTQRKARKQDRLMREALARLDEKRDENTGGTPMERPMVYGGSRKVYSRNKLRQADRRGDSAATRRSPTITSRGSSDA
jgi:hypothetical protein